ncbi:hypothetical protein [Agrococcus sp. HG114]|uniref:hypothetical protein n=1 Tax=Agrococcus sp. HG114 TaxID=2969757 RepID=UPI00215B1AD1|nr:hypothetical protein [Agrococcus sp. HG114]MCR8670508.1 hypothetical protein [Agrococcus sp. HG114]
MQDDVIAEDDQQRMAARLRELLEALQDPAPRSDPRAERQLELCVEVEAILQARWRARDVRASA